VKALLTGGLGFIGYHLAARLLAEGHEVHALDNAQRGQIDASVAALKRSRRYALILGDTADEHQLATLEPDYTHVFHLAAIVGVQNVASQPFRVLRDNLLPLVKVLEWARTQERLKRFVFTSTSEVYAGTLEAFGIPIPTPENTPIAITAPGRPRTSYMLSKVYGEALCESSGLPFTIVRPHNVYGPRMGMAHVVPELLARAHGEPSGGELLVFSPDHSRAFCYVEDATELLIRIALSPEGLNRTFNIGSSMEEVSISSLADLIIEVIGKPLRVCRGPDTEGSPTRRRPDITAAVAVAAYQPRVLLRDGLRRTYDWYRREVFETARVAPIT
jgi:nucleoside-diphosphate-sugar epimerase